MTSFTPGPWKYEYGIVVDLEGRPILAAIRDERATEAGIYPVERDNNLRLAAKSPELLGSVSELLKWAIGTRNVFGCYMDNPDFARLERVIEKAQDLVHSQEVS